MSLDAASARVVVDTERTIAEISPLLFGGFAEHMGRCIYEGIYEPASPHADEAGLRKDVLAALRELNFSIIRYPGGNFVSGYRWEDGVGPRSQRPRRRELAWQSMETNQFGTNEFIEFCQKVGTLPMMGINFGTGSISDAANLVEYCNAPAGTRYADLRVSHGYRHPHAVKYWCLGNEMDGPWQIGHLEMDEYARKAREAAKMMKWMDPSIKLISCGSSNCWMGTYPQWDRVTLETCWEQVDYHSIHFYATNHENDTASYLAMPIRFEEYVDTLAGTLRYVKAKARSKKDVYLSWDEWNVWYKNQVMQGGWAEAPHLIEEVYNLEDALLVAQWLSTFLRKSDVLKIACLAQIVNVIAPLLTTRERLLKQSTFYPFMLFRKYASGVALDVLAKSPLYATKQYGEVPMLDASASFDPASGRTSVFLVNRSSTESLTTEVAWPSAPLQRIDAAWQLAGSDPKLANSFEQPEAVVPRALAAPQIADGRLTLRLPPLSFTVLSGTGAAL